MPDNQTTNGRGVQGKRGVLPWRWIAVLLGLLALVLVGCALWPQPAPAPAGVQASEEVVSPTVNAKYSAADVPMVLIPAGEFQMGSENGENDEKPVHTVYLDAYYMDVYEVTNRRYADCVAEGECTPPLSTDSVTRERYYGNPEYDDYPAIHIDWSQAQTYCQWRGGDLPTEAQWEKAARGGLEGKDYPWGDEAPICQKGAKNGAKFDDNGSCTRTDTETVGSYAPNGYGLYDMAGNVWEWVKDWYSITFYATSPYENPSNATGTDFRVLRGGWWFDTGYYLRVAERNGGNPASGDYSFGFRCMRMP